MPNRQSLRCPDSFSDIVTARSRKCSSGAMPNTSPVSSDTTIVNTSTAGSIAISADRGMLLGFAASTARRPPKPIDGTKRAANQREDHPFGQKLPQQAPAPGAKRGPDGELALPRFGAGQKQVGQVRARDQEDERDRALQHPQRRLDTADQIVLRACRAGCDVPSVRGRAFPG